MPIEITRFEEVDRYLGSDRAGTLLVLDIDQTLMRCPYQWGGEPWYYHLIAERRREGMSDRDAVLAADREWEASQLKIDPELMEKETANFVARWRSESVTVVGLTARAPTIATRTLEQLRRLGVHFSDLVLDSGAKRPEGSTFEQGIFFVGALEPKGILFPRWYDLIRNAPARLVFVDDRHEHVSSMESWLHARAIPGLCLRYGAADPLKAAFDIRVVEEEKRKLGG